MRTALTWLLTIALLAGAWAVAALTPSDDAYTAEFPVQATIGEKADGRTFDVTIQDVRAATRVAAARGWYGEGTWLVVDLDAAGSAPPMSYGTSTTYLGLAELVIDGRTYSASERVPSMSKQELVTGIPYRGVLLFELPEGALDGTATLRLAPLTDTRGDAVVELPIVLGDLEVEPEIELATTEWITP